MADEQVVTPEPVAAVTPEPKAVATPEPKSVVTPEPKAAEPVAKPDWPDDWLSKIAKGDEKLAKNFSKFQSPVALAEAYTHLQRRMSSGEFKPVLPKDPKPEELAQWRKDNGIPETPDKYDLKGVEIPETDKEVVNDYLKAAHAANFTTEQAKTGLAAFYDIQNRQAQVRAQKDEEQRVAALDSLNQEWGGTFRRNVNMIEGLLSQFPENVRDAMKSARLPDGTAAFNSPDILRGFAALALQLNPAGIVVPSSGGDLGKSMLDRYNEIQKFRKEDRGSYNKDSKVQEEERQIIEGLIKHGLMSPNGELKAA